MKINILTKVSNDDLIVLRNLFIGPAVTLDDKDSLYVFGGYDLLSGNVIFRNDFLNLEDLSSKKYEINSSFHFYDKIL